MKKYCAALFLFSVIALSACNKYPKCTEVTTTAPASEIATLKSYIETNKIDASADSRGFYYHIDDAGSGKKPGSCYTVNINYIGKLTNGTIFDQQTGISFDLSSLIIGWQEGVPLIAKGGTITLYLPPSLAYGPSAQGAIPGNSILVFQIKLNSF